jgi:hypothetical protein
MNDNQKLIKKWITEAINKKTENILEYVMEQMKEYQESPAHNIQDFKKRSKKETGDLFENFCVIYLQTLGYTCYLLKDTPQDILDKLSMKRQDLGIDIIALKDSGYHAVQCKFKSKDKNKKYTVLSWKQMSTFYALCSRTPGLSKYIIMTTADYVRKVGHKIDKDETIAYQKLANLDLKVWKQMCDYQEKPNYDIFNLNTPSKEELRLLRLKHFDKFLKN